ncbi:hypothetical protein CEUSTIGMA_g2577.t1 [Chlamydomonas eustigma]|uniref:Uncharacterized protein n=1 Tax=Chlamydomonas eustigma TaxID=1157962 RepID=A0A250WWA5_9CHLO|nr:hypothetical protein CEUSTIGMA_g2577.t1 [Chlamydomonas eustigma]|eukprot:GAX75133.1 hypothetical protein CEUSTIGMA_g2577.t1 [Chlamydomonas eustigma]
MSNFFETKTGRPFSAEEVVQAIQSKIVKCGLDVDDFARQLKDIANSVDPKRCRCELIKDGPRRGTWDMFCYFKDRSECYRTPRQVAEFFGISLPRTQKNAGRTGSRFQNVHLVKAINSNVGMEVVCGNLRARLVSANLGGLTFELLDEYGKPTGDMLPPSQLAKRSSLAHQNNAWKSIKVDGITLDSWVTRLLDDIEEQQGRMGGSGGHWANKDMHGQGAGDRGPGSSGYQGSGSDMQGYKQKQQQKQYRWQDSSGDLEQSMDSHSNDTPSENDDGFFSRAGDRSHDVVDFVGASTSSGLNLLTKVLDQEKQSESINVLHPPNMETALAEKKEGCTAGSKGPFQDLTVTVVGVPATALSQDPKLQEALDTIGNLLEEKRCLESRLLEMQSLLIQIFCSTKQGLERLGIPGNGNVGHEGGPAIMP